MRDRSESDVLSLRLAQRAMTYLAADPQRLLPVFIDAVRELRRKNGPKAPYDATERSARENWAALRDLLLSAGPEADLIRSMAPLYALLPETDRIQVIHEMPLTE